MVNNQSYILCGVVPWELKQRRRWRERKRQKNGRFRLAKQSIQPVRIHLQKKNAKNLTNWTRWNKRDYVWNSATSLIKWRFRSSRRFCCLKGSNENGKKNDWFKVSKKKQLWTCITRFCTFLSRHCTTTSWKCLISRFVEDGNTKKQLSCTFPKLCYSPLEFNSTKICQRTFAKFLEME